MIDFRQFYGENIIEFGTNNKNITLITGANGNGKTGIFRAVMFAMYGELKINQDEKIQDVNLVNLDKLEESLGRPVKSSVAIEIEYNNNEYLIKREVTAIKQEEKIQTKPSDIEVFTRDDGREWIPLDENSDKFIDHILESEIRDFFFFDAEKMQLLETAKTSKNISKEVKNGIVRLLQINSLDSANKILRTMISEKNNDIRNKAKNIELDQKIREREELENELIGINEIKATHLKKKNNLNIRIADIQEKLSETNHIRDLFHKKDTENRILQVNRSNFNNQKKDARHLLSQMSHLIAQDIMIKNEDYLKGYKENKKDKIPLELIEESIKNCECSMCKTKIPKNTRQYDLLNKLQQDYFYSETTPIINSILRVNQKYIRDRPYILKKVSDKITAFSNEEKSINQSELIIEKLEKEIGNQAGNQEELKKLEKDLFNYTNQVNEIELLIEKYNLNERTVYRSLDNVNKEIDMLMLKLDSVKIDRDINNKLIKMQEILQNVLTSYTVDSAKMLSIEMTNVLYKLLDSKDSFIFKGVEISEDFEMRIYDKNGVDRLQDLSMGQGQIFTLSFILSLAKIASKGRSEVNFPLFMDTPFARLSGKNRDNLIENIPKLVNQWILLLTDTELTSVERESFDKYQKYEHLYVLENVNGRTKIIKKNNLNELSLRGE